MKKAVLFTLAIIITSLSFSQMKDTRQKFRIGFDGDKIDYRQILLTIDKNATDDVDWGYDGEMYQVFEDDMFWVIKDKKYVIQATNLIHIDKEIPLGIISSGGEIAIKVDALENPCETMVVYLKDKELNEVYEIQNETYKITLPAGEYTNRFAITFKEYKKEIEQPIFVIKDLDIYYDGLNSRIILNNPNEVTLASVNMYNSIGQHIKSWDNNSHANYIDIPVNVKPGVYFLQSITDIGKSTKKIVVN
ncbi:T9SS type A sorting domain-containing protein [Lutibacter sp.]|uniref:T9SS type A sorting domain-containing protein n=1 Tax=Lutibacter sp. TaxID=1925666 RepID=UPI001A1BC5A9|nr:T9SS type A sorting domain-containing protein [Lutibacter sp.]MBI9040833.1 T9SS type A sorting domain-containing protein [Lutibacter sp.]